MKTNHNGVEHVHPSIIRRINNSPDLKRRMGLSIGEATRALKHLTTALANAHKPIEKFAKNLRIAEHRSRWEYGTFHDKRARRSRRSGVVQFVLWKAGEHGWLRDCFHPCGYGWENEFIPDESMFRDGDELKNVQRRT